MPVVADTNSVVTTIFWVFLKWLSPPFVFTHCCSTCIRLRLAICDTNLWFFPTIGDAGVNSHRNPRDKPLHPGGEATFDLTLDLTRERSRAFNDNLVVHEQDGKDLRVAIEEWSKQAKSGFIAIAC